MRRFARVLLLASAAIFLMAASSDDEVHRAGFAVPQNPPVPPGLRGFQVVTPPPSRATTTTTMVKATPGQTTLAQAGLGAQSTAAGPAIDPEQCRLACAQPYYFCLAGENAVICPDAWSRCVAACDMPAEPDGAVAPPASATAAR
jgi:hypothetical protein